jgi:7-cyano-7-deazaguanine synthase
MKAIVLFSGGVDSTVVLALALQQKKICHALSFDYGQRHKVELRAAQRIVEHYKVKHHLITIDPKAFAKSCLIESTPVPKYANVQDAKKAEITSTYVPGRNTLFLAYALSLAESLQADEIHFGANALDFAGYVDCRPAYFEAFQALTNLAIAIHPPKIVTPLIAMNKQEIVQTGKNLNCPLELTHSCYDPSFDGTSCQSCLACRIREDAFNIMS